MKNVRPTLVIFTGGAFSTLPVEQAVARAHRAATLDLLRNASVADCFDRAILITEDAGLAEAATGQAQTWNGDLSLLIIQPQRPFHFGRALLDVCRTYNLDRVVCLGGGSMPLGGSAELQGLALSISGHGHCVTANNLFSADVVAFWPAEALLKTALPTNDNDLAYQLHYRAGLPFAATPRTLAFNFDIDVPADLAVLQHIMESPVFTPFSGSYLAEELHRLPVEMTRLTEKLQQTYLVMSTLRANLMVAGRVSSWVWRRMELNLPCQTRVLSEERGMRASGREGRGGVRSLLGLYTDLAGIPGLIHALEETCDAAFLDTRVLFAHRRLKVTRHDRFHSDALIPEQIGDPWVREMTEAVLTARIPIVIGGHSLVAGGIWALSEQVRTSTKEG